MSTATKTWDIEKYGIKFETVIEAFNEEVHFALVKTFQNSVRLAHSKSYGKLFDRGLDRESEDILHKDEYYIMWGPRFDKKLEYHGISPLNTDLGNSYKLQGAMRNFMAAVRNAKNQEFFFKRKAEKDQIFVNLNKYPNGKFY